MGYAFSWSCLKLRAVRQSLLILPYNPGVERDSCSAEDIYQGIGDEEHHWKQVCRHLMHQI
jgi:hypothetical protein